MTLVEILAADFRVLLRRLSPGLERVDGVAPGVGIVQRMQSAGRALFEAGVEPGRLLSHRSDIVRGWACYVVAMSPKATLKRRLADIRPLADDSHSGVREWAWMAVRPHLAADLPAAVKLLEPWTLEESANLRRFAIEALRPRGVWCGHITALKQDPSPCRGMLENVRADPTKYVQDSCANWLNDASKSTPAWVKELCARWSKQSKSDHTKRIVRRALRTLAK